MRKPYPFILFFLLFVSFTQAQVNSSGIYAVENRSKTGKEIRTGADRTEAYLTLLEGKKVGVVANHTALIGTTHLIDSLIKRKINVVKIFAPEHGFRGTADAGEHVASSLDSKTGLPIVSLYGNHKKPTAEDLNGVDILVYDIQDVGARFFTYISTLHYVMESCAEQKKPLIVMDRPNPNGHYIDGPVLKEKYKSFVGMHPVPIVYGMTVGEYAQMINGEGWLNNKVQCDLTIVKLEGYNHTDMYTLPVKPSPNLPNMTAVYLYPSLCLFEGTTISVGRGTPFPFQVFGHPSLKDGKFEFTPQSTPGAKDPLYKGQVCYGYNLKEFGEIYIKNNKNLYLFWLIGSYQKFQDKEKFFNDFFDKLAGTDQLKQQIMQGMKEEEIRKSWQPDLDAFKKTRKKYLLYSDF